MKEIRKFFGYLMVFLLTGTSFRAVAETGSLVQRLNRELDHKAEYDHQKISKLAGLKRKLTLTSAANLVARYQLSLELYNEYSDFKNDSAYAYAQRLYTLSKQMQNSVCVAESEIEIGNVLISWGLFHETFNVLKDIRPNPLPSKLKYDYYSLMVRTYFDLGNYAAEAIYAPKYKQEGNRYLDSTIALYKPGSDSYNQILHYKKYVNHQYDNESEAYFLKLLAKPGLSIHLKAMISSTASDFYLSTGQENKAKNMLIQAAIFDIRSSTKATLAIYKLALLLYRQGDIENAYRYLNEALNEAAFFGARQRQTQINAILPVVAAQKLAYSEKENKRFLIFLTSVLVLASLLLGVTIQLFKQLRNVKFKESIIQTTNTALESLNHKLKEDARIKEEYIGYFFDIVSGYIDKMNKLKINIEGKISSKRFEDILITLGKIQVKKERENLFETFDRIFLKIFPAFVQSFNALYPPENQIWPKNGSLTVEIRICALMRLGIHENAKIAKILEYSEKTIYVYKARLKARSLFPLDMFEKRLMEIESVFIPDSA